MENSDEMSFIDAANEVLNQQRIPLSENGNSMAPGPQPLEPISLGTAYRIAHQHRDDERPYKLVKMHASKELLSS